MSACNLPGILEYRKAGLARVEIVRMFECLSSTDDDDLDGAGQDWSYQVISYVILLTFTFLVLASWKLWLVFPVHRILTKCLLLCFYD